MSKIAIITRTSNRPKFFARCYSSAKNQPFVGSHHVLYDNIADDIYLDNKSIIKHYIDVSKITCDTQAPETPEIAQKLCLYNLYFNNGIYNIIQEPWVYHLDDDNYLLNNAFVNLEEHLYGDAELIIFKIYLQHQKWILPSVDSFASGRIQLSDIDTGCFLVKTALARKIKWDGWRAGDYRFILKCSELSKKTLWIDKIVMHQDGSREGNKQDYQE